MAAKRRAHTTTVFSHGACCGTFNRGTCRHRSIRERPTRHAEAGACTSLLESMKAAATPLGRLLCPLRARVGLGGPSRISPTSKSRLLLCGFGRACGSELRVSIEQVTAWD